MRAIRVSRWGGPEVLELLEDVPVPQPGDGHLLVRVNRAGVNYADTHQTENSYLSRFELPLTPGAEVAGTTEDGRRVVALTPSGGYAEYAAVPAATAFVIATASSEEKRALALELGADAAVDVTREDLDQALTEANGGHRVDVVLEMA